MHNRRVTKQMRQNVKSNIIELSKRSGYFHSEVTDIHFFVHSIMPQNLRCMHNVLCNRLEITAWSKFVNVFTKKKIF